MADAAPGHALVQYLEPLLALAAADDLADPRRQPSIAATVLPSSSSRMSKALMPFVGVKLVFASER
jgi:hypothetical protein